MDIKELTIEVEKLKAEVNALKSFASIPFDTDKAFRERLGINSLSKLLVSTKGATTENQAVSEAGAGSYSVLKPPDLFLQVIVSGTTYYVPVYT